MTFDAHTNLWFDELVAYAHRYDAGEAANVTDTLRDFSRKPPTRRNALSLRAMVAHVGHAALGTHVAAVLNRQFRREFRYAFSRRKSQVSAASALFDLINQATTYPR